MIISSVVGVSVGASTELGNIRREVASQVQSAQAARSHAMPPRPDAGVLAKRLGRAAGKYGVICAAFSTAFVSLTWAICEARGGNRRDMTHPMLAGALVGGVGGAALLRGLPLAQRSLGFAFVGASLGAASGAFQRYGASMQEAARLARETRLEREREEAPPPPPSAEEQLDAVIESLRKGEAGKGSKLGE